MLSEHIFQLDSCTFVETNLALSVVNRYLVRQRSLRRRTIKKIERSGQRILHGIQTSITLKAEIDVQTAPDADFTKGIRKQLCFSFDMQITDLLYGIDVERELIRAVIFFESNFAEFEFLNA